MRADHERVYNTMMQLAQDCSSELYYNRLPRRGASHRCAFWDGFDNKKPAYIPRGTISAVCLKAGRDFAKQIMRGVR